MSQSDSPRGLVELVLLDHHPERVGEMLIERTRLTAVAEGGGELRHTVRQLDDAPRQVVLARRAVGEALETWPLHVVEEALGADADGDGVLPHALRTAELRVRLPRHHVAMLEYRAEQEHTTISHILAQELDGIASANADELSAAIPGFAAALHWPDIESAQLPC